jgi:hypothetical protein
VNLRATARALSSHVPLRHCGGAPARSGARLFRSGMTAPANTLTSVPVSVPVRDRDCQKRFCVYSERSNESVGCLYSMKGQPHEAHDNRFILSPDARFHTRACTSCFPVGANPTRQPLQPEATGAVMEETKWLKPSVSVSRIGDSASVQAVTRVNAEQASKRTMRRPTRQPFRGRLKRLDEAERRVRPAAAPG